MAKKGNTPALALLQRSDIAHTVHTYELDSDADSYGEAVAAELGVDPRRLFKTLVAVVDDDPVVAIVPVSARLSLKALARAAGGKRAKMADPSDAERWTGYVTGGISPFGQKRRMPVYVDASISGYHTVYASGGQRGTQVELDPGVLLELLEASSANLTDD